MCNTFRTLKAGEIECRVGTQSEKGVTILLYKDARCDMNILDEKYGAFGWQRDHQFKDGKLYCKVSIKNPETGEWISKEDVGVESNTEQEKGQASDSFKRACVNWGIGRELYTSPFIWVDIQDGDLNSKNKFQTKLIVKEIEYNEKREITKVVITDTKGNIRYPKNHKESPREKDRPRKPNEHDITTEQRAELESLGGSLEIVAKYLKKNVEDLTREDVQNLIDRKKGAKK